MLKIIFSFALFISLSANAAETGSPQTSGYPTGGIGGFRMPSKCIMHANQQVMDFMYGMDPDGIAFQFDNSGKTVILNQSKIVKKTIVNGVETITYKTKVPKYGYGMTTSTEFETMEKTILVTRDADGKITSIAKSYDTAAQFKGFKDSGMMGHYPAMKSMETTFAYNGTDCSLNQTIGTELLSEKAKEEKNVYYDKKFCDQLAPMVKQMGSQNAALCTGLIGQAQMAFDARNKEFEKTGLKFKSYDYFGEKQGQPNYSNNFNLGNMIQSCSMADGMLWGYPGMGMGVPMTGFGLYGGGGPIPVGSGASSSQAPASTTK